MNEWIDELSDLSTRGESAVLVTVTSVRGSAPREAGAKMIVTQDTTIGTIGGGQLEYECTRLACDMLDDARPPGLRKFPLGPSMGQCCGGLVDVLFEPVLRSLPAWFRQLRDMHAQRQAAVIVTDLEGKDCAKSIVTTDAVIGEPAPPGSVTERAREGLRSGGITGVFDGRFFETVAASNRHIAVFGAGHVGAALVRTLCTLDCNVRWIDSRRKIFPAMPPGIVNIESTAPVLEVDAMPGGSYYFVMTHSHALDFDICSRILERRDAAYCGLIGSLTKRRRFEKRFRQQGLAQADIDRLVCPIGIDGIAGKKPAEIAIATAAQVLELWERESRDLDKPSCLQLIERHQ